MQGHEFLILRQKAKDWETAEMSRVDDGPASVNVGYRKDSLDMMLIVEVNKGNIETEAFDLVPK